MTNVLLGIIAVALVIGVALLAKRGTTREARATEDDHDLTRRRPAGQSFEGPAPGALEWTPPGRTPEARG